MQQRDVTGNPALVTDGNTVPEGAVWDGPAAIKLEGTAGSLSYDLGKPTPVSAFILQADANDSYKVSGSSDGKTFNLLVQAANLVDRGHGMRTRRCRSSRPRSATCASAKATATALFRSRSSPPTAARRRRFRRR